MFVEAEHVLGEECQKWVPSLGLVSHTLSRFGESWTQSITPAPSTTPMLATPTLEHTALRNTLLGSSGTQRAVPGLEEMAGVANACLTSRACLKI